MKKKITFVYALIFLISLTFCFSGCQTSKKEIYLFSKGDFNYSEKITFKMGSCTQEKNWELYLRDEARRVKVDEEKLLKAEYIYRVQINLDADILNKTFFIPPRRRSRIELLLFFISVQTLGEVCAVTNT